MKHYFVINPIAGRKDSSETLEVKIKDIFTDINEPYELYITQKPSDATSFIKKISNENELQQEPDTLTFYICGGDGTCFEAVNGIIGFPHSRMTIVPVGSCNDFLKIFKEDFNDLEKLVTGKEKVIDCLKVNDKYCLNVANIGFDAKVNYDCVRFRHKYKTVKQSYNHAIIRNLLHKLGDKVTVTFEDGQTYVQNSLLMALANGGFYGGGYHCAPYAIIDDGLLEFIMVKKVSILTFARLIKQYKMGKHLDNPKLKKILTYRRGRKLTITSDKLLCLCLDGETFHYHKIEVEIIPQAIRFVIPNKEA